MKIFDFFFYWDFEEIVFIKFMVGYYMLEVVLIYISKYIIVGIVVTIVSIILWSL